MARPRKFDQNEVMDKLTLAFWESGFNGISMDDICRVTQLNRGSIYNALGDKRTLYLRVLDVYGEQHYGVAARMIQASENVESAVRDLYQASFKGMNSDQPRWGCLMCNAAVEVAPVDQDVANVVKKYLGLLSKSFLISLQASSADEKNAVYLKNMAEHLTASYVGFNIMARAGMATACLRRISDSAVEMVVARR